jgi:hypothetical protein
LNTLITLCLQLHRPLTTIWVSQHSEWSESETFNTINYLILRSAFNGKLHKHRLGESAICHRSKWHLPKLLIRNINMTV